MPKTWEMMVARVPWEVRPWSTTLKIGMLLQLLDCNGLVGKVGDIGEKAVITLLRRGEVALRVG